MIQRGWPGALPQSRDGESIANVLREHWYARRWGQRGLGQKTFATSKPTPGMYLTFYSIVKVHKLMTLPSSPKPVLPQLPPELPMSPRKNKSNFVLRCYNKIIYREISYSVCMCVCPKLKGHIGWGASHGLVLNHLLDNPTNLNHGWIHHDWVTKTPNPDGISIIFTGSHFHLEFWEASIHDSQDKGVAQWLDTPVTHIKPE